MIETYTHRNKKRIAITKVGIVKMSGKTVLHLHFMCPVYMGLDFTVTATLVAKPESMKPKVEINQKDLDLDKKKGLMDVGKVRWGDK